MAYSGEVFKVDTRPDGGQFRDGASAALAWDVLQRVGRHDIPDTIDLSGIRHLKPYALACLCALGELGRHNGRPIRILKPNDIACAQHLARLGLPQFFESKWESTNQRDSNLRIRRVSWPPGNEASEIIEFLAPRVSLPPGIFARMDESLDEVIRNALSHAASPVDCLVAGQAFPETDKVEIAVIDLGRTIRSHLTGNPEYADTKSDKDAIFKAMEDGVTGTPPGQKNIRGDDNSGAGLAELRDYCETGGGELTILSGSHWVTCRPDHEPVTGNLYGGFRGCLVNIRYFTGNRLHLDSVDPIL